jgi:4-amino-4-deoxy-L-arabinose transferase-like glycosyltransferase
MRRPRSYRRRLVRPSWLLLAAILVAGFALRVWHNDYGLPFVWSIDEGAHFTNRAVQMFHGGLDPIYYQNPAAYTYLIYGLLRVMYGPLGFHLPWGNVPQQFNKDPTQIWIAARTLAAALCMLGVAAVYMAARRLWGVREGIVAAAVLSFAFLPVAYSRVAVTDVGSLIGVAISIYGSLRTLERGRPRDYLIAGLGAGLAVAFKYTAGLVLIPLGIAALGRLRRDRLRAVLCLGLGVAAAALVFFATNPYAAIHYDDFRASLRAQADVASNIPKPGQHSGGVAYYLDSLRWGLGWLGAIGAAIGALIELRRDLLRGLALVAFPIALFVYLSLQSRYFGRWLLPAYPVLAILCALALTRAAALVPRDTAARTAALAGLTALVLVQPVAADVHSAVVLGRADTREEVRNYLIADYPPELRVSIEPAIPGRYFRTNPSGRNPAWLRRCSRLDHWTRPGWSYPGPGGKRVCAHFKPGQFARPDGGIRASAYHLVLNPGVIDKYRFYGYCLVVTFGVVRERALETGDPSVRAYYRRLERESTLVRTFSPYARGARPVPFSFDLSYNYYPGAYHRPGPVARLYRLHNCRQAYGAPVIRIPQARELPPNTPQDET